MTSTWKWAYALSAVIMLAATGYFPTSNVLILPRGVQLNG